jgi:hypothetical protein
VSTNLLNKRVRILEADFNRLLVGQTGTVVADCGPSTDPATFGLVCVLMDAEYMDWADQQMCRERSEANPHNTIEWNSRHAYVQPFELAVTSC